MRTLIFVASLVVFCCVLMLSQDQNSSSPNTAPNEKQTAPREKHPHKGEFSCAHAARAKAYAEDLRLPQGTRIAKVYNVDKQEHGPHDPVCLNKDHGDTIFWWSGTGKRFKLGISPQGDSGKCGKHPFEKDPPSDVVGGYFSDKIRKSAPVGCVYDVNIEFQDGKTVDPHIQIAGTP